ncbi:hypothetical protein ACQ4PT_061621 [Festuca glaucescens]
MPPADTRQRSLRRSAATAAPYCRKVTDRPIKKGRQRRKIRGDPTALLSDDALAGIFAGLSDAADVFRCASTCRRLCRVVATSATIVSRSLPLIGRFLPDLAVGIFHREIDLPAIGAVASLLPCFVPVASAARFLGDGHQRLLSVAGLGDGSGLLDHSRPVASRNGRLVLELRREGRAIDCLRLAICNPMMHKNIVVVPPLISSAGAIQEYSCALLTGQDLRPPRCNTFFRLLLVYNHNRGPGNSTVLRCYSSDTGCWGQEAECSVEIPSLKICDIGQAVVHRGVAFWALDLGVLGARLDQIDQHGAVMDMHLVPYVGPQLWAQNRLLGISPDNRLFYMHTVVVGWKKVIMMAKLSYFKFEEEDNIHTGTLGICCEKEFVRMHQMKVSDNNTAIKLRWFGEKSGNVLFTMGRPSGHRGTFMLNLRDSGQQGG